MGVDRATLMSNDFTATQAWGLAIQRHRFDFQGLKYSSRFLARPCLALFGKGDLPDRLVVTRIGVLAELNETTAWLERYKLRLV
jgi:hypothetical protein